MTGQEQAHGFSYGHSVDTKPRQEHFQLHHHPGHYEIYIFLKGEAEFLVEGTHYPLEPYDIIIAQNFEMHCVVHHRFTLYERIVIDVPNSFFVKNECETYKKLFLNRPLGEYNKIPAEAVKKHGIPALLERMEAYLNDREDAGVVARCAMIELLYHLNRIGVKMDKSMFHHEEQIKEVILYINKNLTGPLSLEEIAEQFFITKYHLCRIFKQHTGYTVNQYVTHKRLMLAKELAESGRSWTEASVEAGFGNYSNFYKMFCREYGHSPSCGPSQKER